MSSLALDLNELVRLFSFFLLLPLPWTVLGGGGRVLIPVLLAWGSAADSGPVNADISIWLFEIVLGALAAVPFIACAAVAEQLGEFVETGRGQSIGSVFDPGSYEPSIALASGARGVTLALALMSGALESALGGLLHVPGLEPGAAFGALILQCGELIGQILVTWLVSGALLAVPFLLIALAVELVGLMAVRLVSLSSHADVLFSAKFLISALLLSALAATLFPAILSTGELTPSLSTMLQVGHVR